MSVSSVDSVADASFEDHIEMKNQAERKPLLKKHVQIENDTRARGTEHVPRRAPVGALPRVDEADDESDEDPLLEVMDRIEDEVDGNLYDDLVPLHVKLALEQNLFGWSHLFSDICGHIMFTAGYYLVAYIAITEICWRRTSDGDSELRWGMRIELFNAIRFLLSFTAGLSGFRTVRRRRKVWLRVPNGMQAYERDERRRRESVEESDRSTLLGRIRRRRDGWLERRVQRKLFKASSRFDKKIKKLLKSPSHRRHSEHRSNLSRMLSDGDRKAPPVGERKKRPRLRTDHSIQRRTSLTGPTNSIESVAHDQVLFEPGPILNMPYAHGGFFGAAPFMLANPYWIDILRHLMPDVYVEISRRVVNAPASKLIHWAENNPVVAAYGTAHELEYSDKVPAIEWDVFLDPHLVDRVQVVLDERDKFLRACAPTTGPDACGGHDLHLDEEFVRSAIANMTTSQRTIVRYYDAEVRRRTFLLVDRMLIAHGNLTQLIWEQTGYAKKYNFSRVKRTRRTLGGGIFARQWLALYAEALKFGMVNDDDENENEPGALYSSGSSDSSVGSTVTLSDDEEQEEYDAVSPGKVSTQETGCSSSEGDNFGRSASEMKRSTSEPCLSEMNAIRGGSTSRSTGIRPSLYEDMSDSEVHKSHKKAKRNRPIFRMQSTSLNALASSKCPDSSMTMSMSVLKSIMRSNAPLGLFLDIKSRHVSKRIWALVVGALRETGARVEGVCSFYPEDIRGISQYCSSPVREVIFFHSAGDMQQACHNGEIKPGDIVLFNGGSLLWDPPVFSKQTIVRNFLDRLWSSFDPACVKNAYRFLPFAEIEGQCNPLTPANSAEHITGVNGVMERSSRVCLEREMDGVSTTPESSETSREKSDLITHWPRSSTIQMYKKRFRLSIGIYCQEFAIDEAAANMLVTLVNVHPEIYDLGLSWGGVNGITVRDIQPGRFTYTDGFWNQRYAGVAWDSNLVPPPEDGSSPHE